jgi:ubiquitin carboxyl-terminal hydrolase 34
MAGHDAVQVNTTGQQFRSPKAPSSEPSLPRRDSVDGDVTLTRKRPRLDSGSRSKSADRVLSASNQEPLEHDRNFLAQENQESGGSHAAPTAMVHAKQGTPNKVTINLRNPQQASNGEATAKMPADAEDRRDSHVSPAPASPKKENLDNGYQEYSNLSNGVTSPLSISSSPEIEIEIGDPEDLDDDPATVDIQLDGVEDDLVLMMLERFPYANKGDWVQGAKAYVDHLDTAGMSFGFPTLNSY